MKAKIVLNRYTQGERNFQKMNLPGQSFKEKNLQGADFSGANLQRANFSGAELQGANFSGADLRGTNFRDAKLEKRQFGGELQVANFREADIRSANFRDALLREADFSRAKAGLRMRYTIFWGVGSLFLLCLLGFIIPIVFFGFLLYLTEDLFYLDFQESETLRDSLLILSIFLIGFLDFIILGLRQSIEAALGVVPIAVIATFLVGTDQPVIFAIVLGFIVTGLLILIINLSWNLRFLGGFFILLFSWFVLEIIKSKNIFFENIEYNGLLIIIITSIPVTILTMIGISLTIYRAKIIQIPKPFAVAIGIALPALSTIIVLAIAILDQSTPTPVEIYILLFIYGIGIVFGSYLGIYTIAGDKKYELIRNLVAVLDSWRSTSFQCADLTEADFSEASLQSTDFRGANLTRTQWKGAKKLERTRVSRSYLQYPEIRKLVVDKSVEKGIFDFLNLEGINLSDATLKEASFFKTNLKNADLRQADLSDTELIETKLDGAYLKAANLTGACIENWQITAKTNLDSITCDYLYLRKQTPGNPDRIRHPEEGTLTPEDKIKLFTAPEKKFPEVYKPFAELYAIEDKIIRECRLIEAAKQAKEKYGIELDSYRQMFKDYCQQRIDDEWQQSLVLSMFVKIERWIEKINRLMSQADLFPVLDNLGKLSILVAVIFFVNGLLKEEVEPKYRAWEIINSDGDLIKGGSQLALENLVKKGVSLKGINAQGKNLSKFNLRNADLTDADLSGAVLKNADLRGAKLKGANLHGADLSSVNLGWKDRNPEQKIRFLPNSLQHNESIKDISRHIGVDRMADLSNANLIGANLKEADLTDAKLEDALYDERTQFPENFSDEIKKKMLLINPRADLSQEDLTGKDLRGVNLREADLRNVNFRGTNLSGADLRNANLRGTNLKETNLSGAKLENALYDDLTQFPKDFVKNKKKMLWLTRGANLSGKDLSGKDLSRADLTGADLRNANFRGTNLKETNLSGAKLENALYDDLTQFPEDFVKNKKKMLWLTRGANLSGKDLSGKDLSHADLTGANLRNADLRGTNLRDVKLEKAFYDDGTQFPDNFDVNKQKMRRIAP